jgi:hypothetical protein
MILLRLLIYLMVSLTVSVFLLSSTEPSLDSEGRTITLPFSLRQDYVFPVYPKGYTFVCTDYVHDRVKWAIKALGAFFEISNLHITKAPTVSA